ncbi:hypothetical protein CRE_16000 [Caenorhabditis remanei]|uniref:DUF7622 domain-containing protein n=1 Tax=Caenorhabditis remanei TaxID=31234 RepID=E3MB88_CAERE|nr:hypothetical protein CRE_16000 [Caenorhabditis remanei]
MTRLIRTIKRLFCKTCLTGIKKPNSSCTLDHDDNMVCVCDTDFCNTIHLYRSNATILPITECKAVNQLIYETRGCNKCIRSISYLKNDDYELNKFPNSGANVKDLSENIQCNTRGDSGDFILDQSVYMPERLYRNFFAEACYNFSMNQYHYYIHCRCASTNCNSPETPNLPYPIAPPRIKCFTSGYDVDVNNKKYENLTTKIWYKDNYRMLMTNVSYVDDNSECQGHYCVIAVDEGILLIDTFYDIYYKGCISANEQGPQKLALGYSYLNDVRYYICNEDYCNADIETALESAKNSSIDVRDNSSDRKNILIVFFFLCFSFEIF